MRTEGRERAMNRVFSGKCFVERTMEGVTKREHLENRYKKGTPAMPFVTAQQECSSPALKEAWGKGEKQGIVK